MPFIHFTGYQYALSAEFHHNPNPSLNTFYIRKLKPSLPHEISHKYPRIASQILNIMM